MLRAPRQLWSYSWIHRGFYSNPKNNNKKDNKDQLKGLFTTNAKFRQIYHSSICLNDILKEPLFEAEKRIAIVNMAYKKFENDWYFYKDFMET